MPSKVFNFEEEGLKYSVTVTQEEDDDGNLVGPVTATVTVIRGHMDVNAIYFADNDQSDGGGANLEGPQNMNGKGSQHQGERIDWDGVEPISMPGLGGGRTGLDGPKPSYLVAGTNQNSLTVDLDVNSIDDIDFIGIRATSTSTTEGSIKGVSVPEDPEDPDCDLPDDTDKVLFVFTDSTGAEVWEAVFATELLAAGNADPTLQDYYTRMLEKISGNDKYDIANLSEITAYRFVLDADGNEVLDPIATFTVGEPPSDDSPLPIICVEEHGDAELYADEDSLDTLVA